MRIDKVYAHEAAAMHISSNNRYSRVLGTLDSRCNELWCGATIAQGQLPPSISFGEVEPALFDVTVKSLLDSLRSTASLALAKLTA